MSHGDDDLTTVEIVVAETTAAIVGASLGPLGIVVTPALAAGLEKVNRDFKRAQEARALAVLAGAANELQVSPEDAAGLAGSPAASRLLVRAMAAGANTDFAVKIEALGRVLAHGLGGDEASIEIDAMIVAALGEMEAPHIKVLAHIGHATGGKPRAGAWREGAMLPSAFPNYREALPAILAVLDRHGLVSRRAMTQRDLQKTTRFGVRRTGIGTAAWELTTFGAECLAFLELEDQ